MSNLRWYTCTLYKGKSARGKEALTTRVKAASKDDASIKFTEKYRYNYPPSRLMVGDTDNRVGYNFPVNIPYGYDDEEVDEEEEEDDWEDEEEEDEEEYFDDEDEELEEEDDDDEWEEDESLFGG